MSDLCQVVPEENSNTDIFSSSTNALYKYDFVINNYTDSHLCQMRQYLNKNCRKWIMGFEIGESGTPHIQGYMSLIRKCRKSTIIRATIGDHISMRPVRNDTACQQYCMKDGKYESRGFPQPIRIIEKLYQWQSNIIDIYDCVPDDRSIYWFWEPNGGVGKSAFVKYMVVKYGVLFCNGGKHTDLINLIFNNSTDDFKCIIWDIPRASEGKVSYSTLECVKNGMICNTKYETGVKCFNPPHIFIFANFPPENPEKLSTDRWKIIEL